MKLSDALVQAEIRNTPFAKAHIQTMREQAIGQTNLGAILDTGLLLPNELSAMKVLGTRVSYTELLSESGQHHSEHVAKQLEKCSSGYRKPDCWSRYWCLGLSLPAPLTNSISL
ncbi:hypothetical protein QYZ38_17190 [Vibrio parahaemolyticus]|nr:hypothetical protein [Vibrio parahaemolyticus]